MADNDPAKEGEAEFSPHEKAIFGKMHLNAEQSADFKQQLEELPAMKWLITRNEKELAGHGHTYDGLLSSIGDQFKHHNGLAEIDAELNSNSPLIYGIDQDIKHGNKPHLAALAKTFEQFRPTPVEPAPPAAEATLTTYAVPQAPMAALPLVYEPMNPPAAVNTSTVEMAAAATQLLVNASEVAAPAEAAPIHHFPDMKMWHKNPEEVKQLQTFLRDHGQAKMIDDHNGVDGVFGEGTREAVKNIQRENGLKADGIIGHDTRTLFDNIQKEDNRKAEMGVGPAEVALPVQVYTAGGDNSINLSLPSMPAMQDSTPATAEMAQNLTAAVRTPRRSPGMGG